MTYCELEQSQTCICLLFLLLSLIMPVSNNVFGLIVFSSKLLSTLVILVLTLVSNYMY